MIAVQRKVSCFRSITLYILTLYLVMPQLLGYLVYKPLTAEGTGDESGQEGMMSIGGR